MTTRKAQLFQTVVVWSFLTCLYHTVLRANVRTQEKYQHNSKKAAEQERYHAINKRRASVPLRGALVSQDDVLSWDKTTIQNMIKEASTKYLPKNKDEISIYTGLGFGAVLEMEDPIGGRSFHCLEEYFYTWKKQENVPTRVPLIESFFEWLDYGDGRNIEIDNCDKEDFDERRYHKFTATERLEHEVEFAIEAATNQTVANLTWIDYDFPVEKGKYMFVWGTDKKLYLLDKDEDEDSYDAHIHGLGHATIFCGRPVLFAGELFINGANGTVKWINDESGHYKPKLRHMRNFVRWLRDEVGVDPKTIDWRRRHHGDSNAYDVLIADS